APRPPSFGTTSSTRTRCRPTWLSTPCWRRTWSTTARGRSCSPTGSTTTRWSARSRSSTGRSTSAARPRPASSCARRHSAATGGRRSRTAGAARCRCLAAFPARRERDDESRNRHSRGTPACEFPRYPEKRGTARKRPRGKQELHVLRAGACSFAKRERLGGRAVREDLRQQRRQPARPEDLVARRDLGRRPPPHIRHALHREVQSRLRLERIDPHQVAPLALAPKPRRHVEVVLTRPQQRPELELVEPHLLCQLPP